MVRLALVVLLALVAQPAQASLQTANPIRKVVTMLQAMTKKVEAEGEKEKQLYDSFMCYCKSGGGALQASIDAAETKGPRVSSDIEEAKAQKAQTEADLKRRRATAQQRTQPWQRQLTFARRRPPRLQRRSPTVMRT
jgi:hypothetical protein